MADSFAQSVKKLYTVLELERKIVGVQLLHSEAAFMAAEAIVPQRPLHYCGMVKAAAASHAVKAASEHFACRSGPRVLGIDPADPKNSQGENWARLGLYCNATVSRTIRENLVYNTKKEYGVLVQPLECYDMVPDLVLLVATPYNCMRLTQGYAYHHGMPTNINMIGNQAICLECSARPYVLKDFNASLLCIGTRHRAGWKEEEMAVGFPGKQWQAIVDGVIQTMNLMESDCHKSRIETAAAKAGFTDLKIRYHHNYYMDA